MNAKKLIEAFEIIEENEPLTFKQNLEYIFKTKDNTFPILRMEQKCEIDIPLGRVEYICSLEENNNIYNKLCVGFNTGIIKIYNLNKGNI